MQPPDPRGEEPSLTPREEIILLTLFAIDPDASHQVRELASIAEFIAMTPQELAKCLHTTRACGLIEFCGETEGITLSPEGRGFMLQLAEERLTDNILRQRSLQEQAEALVIWRLERM